MIVSHKHEFIFIKTRKTAGSTLEKLLYPRLGCEDICTGSPRDETPQLNTTDTNGHMGWERIKKKYPYEWKNYFKFTIERNPWDKVVSSYFWHKTIKEERFGAMSFEDYVMNCELLPKDWSKYTEDNGSCKVDVIFKYEYMSDMYSILNNLFGIDIDQEEYNTTKCKSGIRKIHNYKELHTPQTTEKVAQLFENEIELLGYSYE